ncbi:MAG: TolC family outer membrane protein [Sphingomonadaceae bacterium]
MNRLGFILPTVVAALLARPCSAETLADAVHAALAGNPALAAAEARQDALAERPEQARAEGRINASLDAVGGYDKFDYGKGGAATVSASLPLWTGGRILYGVRAAEGEVAAGDEALRDTRAQLITAVVAAYSDVLYNQQALTIARADIDLLQHQVNEAKARFGLGRATRTDVAQLESQLASAEAAAASAQAMLDDASASYRALVGHLPGELASATELTGLPLSREDARDEALADNPRYAQSQRLADAASARVKQARAAGAPSLSLGGNYGYGFAADAIGGSGYTHGAAAGLTLHVPILTSGLVASRVRQAGAELRAARYDREAAAREATRQVDTAWADLDGARTRLGANQRRLDAAELALRGVRAEYAYDLRTTLDILLADESLRATQLALAQSRSDVLVAQARLLQATGKLGPSTFAPKS